MGTEVEDVTSIGPSTAVRVDGENVIRAEVRRVFHVVGRSRWIGLGTLASVVGVALAVWQIAFK